MKKGRKKNDHRRGLAIPPTSQKGTSPAAGGVEAVQVEPYKFRRSLRRPQIQQALFRRRMLRKRLRCSGESRDLPIGTRTRGGVKSAWVVGVSVSNTRILYVTHTHSRLKRKSCVNIFFHHQLVPTIDWETNSKGTSQATSTATPSSTLTGGAAGPPAAHGAVGDQF